MDKFVSTYKYRVSPTVGQQTYLSRNATAYRAAWNARIAHFREADRRWNVVKVDVNGERIRRMTWVDVLPGQTTSSNQYEFEKELFEVESNEDGLLRCLVPFLEDGQPVFRTRPPRKSEEGFTERQAFLVASAKASVFKFAPMLFREVSVDIEADLAELSEIHESRVAAVQLAEVAAANASKTLLPDGKVDKEGTRKKRAEARKASLVDSGFDAKADVPARLQYLTGFRFNGEQYLWDAVIGNIFPQAIADVEARRKTFFTNLQKGKPASMPGFKSNRNSDSFFGYQFQSTLDSLITPGEDQNKPLRSRASTVRLKMVVNKVHSTVSEVPVVYHRAIPAGARVGQVGWSFKNGKWHVLLSVIQEHAAPAPVGPLVSGSDAGVAKNSTVRTFNSDTGVCVREVDYPALSGPTRVEAKRILKRERSLAKTHLANSPDCFKEGVHVKGRCLFMASTDSNPRGASKTWWKKQSELNKLHERIERRRNEQIEVRTAVEIAATDVMVVEDLAITNMVAAGPGKRGLNRSIHAQKWGQTNLRLEHKAARAALPEYGGRTVVFEKVGAAYTSQDCSVCGHRSKDNRLSQAEFECVSCGHTENADYNAATNIAHKSIYMK